MTTTRLRDFGSVERSRLEYALLGLIVVIIAFLLLYTVKGFIYGVFVFFLSIFIVTQIGLQGVDLARFGGNERIIATLIGIAIAFVTVLILRFIVSRDSFHRDYVAAAN